MKFNVKITQILEGHVEIEAESAAAAMLAADALYNKGGVELPDMDDVSPLRFSAEPVLDKIQAPEAQTEHPSGEEIRCYLIAHGYAEPSNDLIEEFLYAGENQFMYDETVRNGYSVGDLDRWLSLKNAIEEPISFRAAMMIDDALWEEEYDSMEVSKKSDIWHTPELICRKRLETLADQYNHNRSDLKDQWSLQDEDLPKLARAFSLTLCKAPQVKPPLSSLIDSADSRQSSVTATHPTPNQQPHR